ncbi:MAG: glycosyltransferase family 1 protein [Steroidobacteraceae bacterium]
MRIAFDHQTFTLQSYGGISRYFVRLAQGLATQGIESRVVAPIHRNRYLRELPARQVWGMEARSFPPRTHRAIMWLNEHVGSLPVRRFRPDLIHETYYARRSFSTSAAARVVTVYDMIHERFPAELGARDQTSSLKRLALQRANHIISISHSTKKDLCELFSIAPDKVSVVHLGVDRLRDSGETQTGSLPGDRPFILYVGNRGGYKNFAGLLRAYASNQALRTEVKLFAFGGGAFRPEEIELMRELGLQDNVHQFGGDDQVLGTLYRAARALVYPSKYEGFGLPPLEAMALNCPVAASNTSSMPEIIGDAGKLFDPENEDAMVAAISEVVFDSKQRANLIQKGQLRVAAFSWDRCATETAAVYRAVLAKQA